MEKSNIYVGENGVMQWIPPWANPDNVYWVFGLMVDDYEVCWSLIKLDRNFFENYGKEG